jgi:hypothetical protein
MFEVTLSESVGKALLSGKRIYLVTRRFKNNDLIVLETFSKKEAYLKADFEAKNKADLSKHRIVLTRIVKWEKGYSFWEKYINEKTLNRTINSKKFNKLKT